MKIVFFGSDEFAVAPLKAIAKSGYHIAAVVTQPDKRKGRGMLVSSTAVKSAANCLNLNVYQPQDVNEAKVSGYLKSLSAEVFVVIAYGQKLSCRILNLPDKMCINLHASLLPQYRGAAPINWALINADKITGVSVIKMVEEMDAGPVILQKKVLIEDRDNSLTLADKLSESGIEVLLSAMKQIESGTCNLVEQDRSKATFAKKLKKTDGLINWVSSAEEIHNLIRGCYAWPGAYTHYRGKILKIHKSLAFTDIDISLTRHSPGTISRVIEDGIVVCTGKGDLIIEELQIEGKRKMTAREFVSGHKIKIGEKLGI